MAPWRSVQKPPYTCVLLQIRAAAARHTSNIPDNKITLHFSRGRSYLRYRPIFDIRHWHGNSIFWKVMRHDIFKVLSSKDNISYFLKDDYIWYTIGFFTMCTVPCRLNQLFRILLSKVGLIWVEIVQIKVMLRPISWRCQTNTCQGFPKRYCMTF